MAYIAWSRREGKKTESNVHRTNYNKASANTTTAVVGKLSAHILLYNFFFYEREKIKNKKSSRM